MPLFEAWFDEMGGADRQPNPNCFTLGTVTADLRPRARVVLCRGIDAQHGHVTFFTSYASDKGKELAANPNASASFHWDFVQRQVRFEGRAVRAPEAESDAYFARRHWMKRVGAWASEQSKPIGSREELIEKVGAAVEKLGLDLMALMAIDEGGPDVAIPRPPYWGGFRIWIDRAELWCAGEGRVHDRARWTRELTPEGDGFTGSEWVATRLQP